MAASTAQLFKQLFGCCSQRSDHLLSVRAGGATGLGTKCMNKAIMAVPGVSMASAMGILAARTQRRLGAILIIKAGLRLKPRRCVLPDDSGA